MKYIWLCVFATEQMLMSVIVIHVTTVASVLMVSTSMSAYVPVTGRERTVIYVSNTLCMHQS